MANVKIIINGTLVDGHEVTFKAPCDCTSINYLDVRYIEDMAQVSKFFKMKDSHGADLTGIGNLFAKDAYVKVILDTQNGFAYLQNAATNSYIENKLGAVSGSAEGTSFDDTIGVGADNVQTAIEKVFQYGNNVKAGLVDSLEFSGLGIEETDTFEEIFADLKARFPAGVYDFDATWVPDKVNAGASSASTIQRLGEDIIFKSEFANGHTAWCETSNLHVGDYTHMKIRGKAECSAGDAQGNDATATIIVGTEEPHVVTIPYGGSVDFEYVVESNNAIKIETEGVYQKVKVTFDVYLYNESESGGDADISSIVEKLNYYTGETGDMTIEEIVSKIDGILGEITANKTRARGFYYYAKELTEIRNPLDLSSIEDVSQLCQGCSNLTYVAPLHTEDATDVSNIFNGCRSLVKVESVNFSSVKTSNSAFKSCDELVYIRFNGVIPISLDFSACPKLSPDSIDSIADALVDLTGKTALTITFHADTIITSSQRAKMTGKNWSVAGGKEV